MMVLLTPVLLGVIGLTVDGGLMLFFHRLTQNAADAAALAAAVDLKNGKSSSAAKATGTAYGQSYNNMPNAPTINIPPSSGPHSTGPTNGHYAEAIVSYPFQTSFIQLLGVNASQTIMARAVAGWEPQSAGDGVIALSTNGTGINVSGGANLAVNGLIAVNSMDSSTAVRVSYGSHIYTNSIDVAGTVSGASSIQDYPSGGGTGGLTQNTGDQTADLLSGLAVPTTSNGVQANFYQYTYTGDQWVQSTASNPQAVTINNTTPVTLDPGIYKSITVQGGASVTFNAGIYVLEGGGLTISRSTATGSGAMFYNTASTYNSSTGADGSGASYGMINIRSSTVTLSAINNPGDTYDGMLFFQDRSNTQTVTMSGNSGGSNLSGTIYAPAADLNISGAGNWGAQIIVSRVTVKGNSTLTIDYSGSDLAKAPYVFLVE
jgi:hypothetical protein